MKGEKQLATFRRTLEALEDSLGQPKNDYLRDASILRFELAFDAGWKAAQTFVRAQGVEANSPRSAFQQAFRLGWMGDDEVIWEAIVTARNEAVHVYSESLAESLYGRLPSYLEAFRLLERSLAGQ